MENIRELSRAMSLQTTVGEALIYWNRLVQASLVAQMVKNPPAVQETWVCRLEEGMAAHSSILTWRIPWTEEPGRLQSTGSERVKHN